MLLEGRWLELGVCGCVGQCPFDLLFWPRFGPVVQCMVFSGFGGVLCLSSELVIIFLLNVEVIVSQEGGEGGESPLIRVP